MLKATKVYCYELGCKSMLSIGGDELAKSTIFRHWGDDLAKLTRLQMSNFLPTMKTKKKKVITFPDANFFAQNEVKEKKKVIIYADAQFWELKILGGCCRIIGGIHPSMDLHP